MIFWYIKRWFQRIRWSYNDFLKKIEEIKISEEKNKWDIIVEEFKNRFYVPFNPHVTNIDKSILWIEIPNIEFQFCKKYEFHNCKDDNCFDNSNNYTSLSREEIDWKQVLSQWEKRAMYLLNVLFEIEVRKQDNKQHLLIIDDIADSFDYKNKYAIIQYLFDLSQEIVNIWTEGDEKIVKKFNIILLTHNFDFFRNINSRLNVKRNKVLNTIKLDDRLILEETIYQNNPFNTWKNNYHKKQKKKKWIWKVENWAVLISMIPFVRNISEYTNWIWTDKFININYQKLTSLLHLKKWLSEHIKLRDLEKIIQNIIPEKKEVKLCEHLIDDEWNSNESLLVIDYIKEIWEKIYNDTWESLELEKKITLAICIRLISEEFMIKEIYKKTNHYIFLNSFTKNQTFELFNLYSYFYKNSEYIKILSDVILMTPENIHLNSFMYEPILDMSDWHLIELYKKVNILNNEVS